MNRRVQAVHIMQELSQLIREGLCDAGTAGDAVKEYMKNGEKQKLLFSLLQSKIHDDQMSSFSAAYARIEEILNQQDP